DGLAEAAAAKTAKEGRTVLRRLNRFEYANTVRDLLGVDVNVLRALPDDANVQGFDNVAEALALSPAHLERYLEAAELALDDALPLPPEPKPTRAAARPLTPEELKRPGEKTLAAVTRGDALVVYRNSLDRDVIAYRTPAAGWYRFRIPLLGTNLDGKAY